MEEDELKQRKSKKIRLSILFTVIFLLFASLIFRLGYVQIIKGREYTSQVKRTEETVVSYPVPRGEIYDANYNLVVYNTPEKAINYTAPKNPQPEEFLDLAKKLARLIKMTDKDIKRVTNRDLKDLWLLEHRNGEDLINKKELKLYQEKKLNDKDLYELKLKRIKDNNIQKIDRNMAAIYRKLSTALAFTPTIIKNENVTDQEYAKVSERLADLPGIEVTTDWARERAYNDTFWNMLGGVTSTDEGLPAEKVDALTAKGFQRNDRVGKTYIEELYDDILQGKKKKVKMITDRHGNVVDSEEVFEGKSGMNLILSVDFKFQEKVEKIIEEELKNAIRQSYTDTLDTAFVVAMEPKTGYIHAMSGKVYNRETETFSDYTPGTFTFAFEQGSVVKGATLLAGYATGVRDIGEMELDEVMRIRGSGTFSSHTVMNQINDLTALERSSNVYMWKTAIEMMGGKYIPDGPLIYDPKKIETIRYYFNQLGLGVPTGIGFPNEATGLKGMNQGAYFQIAIGQLDTYTPMQIAQYMSTIANGGYRMKPQLVREIREKAMETEGGLGKLVKTIDPVVLNKLDMNEEMISRVQQGFWLVTHGSQGTAASVFRGEPYNAAGKTGTSESIKNGIKTWNQSFAGYAPFDNPEIAIAVIVPNAYRDGVKPPHRAAIRISQRVFRAYFEK